MSKSGDSGTIQRLFTSNRHCTQRQTDWSREVGKASPISFRSIVNLRLQAEPLIQTDRNSNRWFRLGCRKPHLTLQRMARTTLHRHALHPKVLNPLFLHDQRAVGGGWRQCSDVAEPAQTHVEDPSVRSGLRLVPFPQAALAYTPLIACCHT